MRRIGVCSWWAVVWLVCSMAAGSATAQDVVAGPCRTMEAFKELDFWLGEWDVYVGEKKVGTNRIEKVLAGCAVEEHWVASGGGQGQSLFYYDPQAKHWKQVWVTEDTSRPGGLKEKALVEHLENGGVRFQGQISRPDRGSYLDRTTLVPLGKGRVGQTIEISTDGGGTWRAVFDSIYVRPGEHPPAE